MACTNCVGFESGSQVRGTVDIDDTAGHELGRLKGKKTDGFTQFLRLRDTTNAALISNIVTFKNPLLSIGHFETLQLTIHRFENQKND